MRIGKQDLDLFYKAAEASVAALRDNSEWEVWLHYSGDLAEPYANALTARIERIAEERIPGKQERKRFVSSFFEALQNVRNHGCVDLDGRMHAAISIFRNENFVFIDMMNVGSNKQVDLVEKKYREANSMEREKLKQVYMEEMSNGQLSDKGGAGLGVLTIVLKSQVPVATFSKSIGSDFKFFALRIGVGAGAP